VVEYSKRSKGSNLHDVPPDAHSIFQAVQAGVDAVISYELSSFERAATAKSIQQGTRVVHAAIQQLLQEQTFLGHNRPSAWPEHVYA
jgi:hypothetical protein